MQHWSSCLQLDWPSDWPNYFQAFRALLAVYAGPAASLMDLMHVTAFLVMYAGFLRYDEVAEVCVHSDMLRIFSTHMDIFIPRSKTDQHWEGKWVSIARVGGNLCPVGLVERLLKAGGYVRTPPLASSDVGPLVRPVVNTRGQHRLKQYLGTLNQPIMSTSYDRLRQRMRDMCAAAGVTKHITMHSMRIGGITAAAEKGVPDRLLMKHGRWVSEYVKNHYIRESLQNMLLVSQSLGLRPIS
jgi:hypothetical protein